METKNEIFSFNNKGLMSSDLLEKEFFYSLDF